MLEDDFRHRRELFADKIRQLDGLGLGGSLSLVNNIVATGSAESSGASSVP